MGQNGQRFPAEGTTRRPEELGPEGGSHPGSAEAPSHPMLGLLRTTLTTQEEGCPETQVVA